MTEVTASSLGPAVPKPAHVPENLVVDFDMWADPALKADPHARILDLVTNSPPIFWTPRQGGGWVIIGHEANFEASRDWESFSSEPIPYEQFLENNASRPEGTQRTPTAVPILVDPPLHGKFRSPINQAFSPRAMNALKGEIRKLAGELIDKVAGAGGCEFMHTIAEPFPVQVFLKLMGLPLERQAEYREIIEAYFSTAVTRDQFDYWHQRIAAIMNDTFLERREQPRDDVISLLWSLKIDDEPTTLDNLEDYGVLLFTAGLDTVMQAMGFGVRHLAQDLATQDRLRADPKLIPEAAEEIMRRYTFTVPPRYVVKDVVFRGVEMKKGDNAWLYLPGANLDPRHWPNPGRFDMDREDNVHIAFNSGPHRCIGSHLARIELQVLYEELLARLPRFQLDPESSPTFHGGLVIGVDSLNLVWA